VQCQQIDRQRINLLADACERAMHNWNPLAESGYKSPDSLVARMEDVRSIHMNIDAFDVLRVRVPRNVIALVDDQARLAVVGCDAGKRRTKRAGTHDQIVEFPE
jgi:hypothetical protein